MPEQRMTEQRAFPRFRAEVMVDFNTQESKTTGITYDISLGGMFVLVPYVLIVAHGYSATQAGAALPPLPLIIAVASPPWDPFLPGSARDVC